MLWRSARSTTGPSAEQLGPRGPGALARKTCAERPELSESTVIPGGELRAKSLRLDTDLSAAIKAGAAIGEATSVSRGLLAMISPKTLAAIRERTEIAAIVGETVKLVQKGRSLVGLCPFHKEKSPSFTVSPERGFFHCFGCKESGSAFDFLMKLEGLTFPEAARRLAERAGVVIEEMAGEAERREAEAARRVQDDLYAVNQLAAHFFEEQLREHPLAHIAREELARRGLAPERDPKARDALQAFRIGYAPAGWSALSDYLARQGVSPVAAANVGVIAARSQGPGYYDRFRNRLMFAVVDTQGRVIAFSGRALPDPESQIVDKETPKYVNSPESPIYQKGHSLFGLYQAKGAIREEGEAVLVEGNFDVVSLHARAIAHVVAPLGTAFTAAQARLLKRYTPSVTLLFDGDTAGRKATREARDTCQEVGLETRVAVLGTAKDPDDFIRERGAPALLAALKASRGILEHLIESALDEGFEHADARERASRAKEVVDLIQSEKDLTVRAMAKKYADRVAQRLGLTQGASSDPVLASLVARLSQANGGPRADEPRGSPGPGREASGEPAPPWRARSHADAFEVALEMIGCLLDFPDLLSMQDPSTDDALAALEGDAALAVAAMRQAAGMTDGLDLIEVLAHVPPSIHTFAARRLASPRYDQREQARERLLLNAQKLKKAELSREKTQVAEELERIERTGDVVGETELLRELFARGARKQHGL
jgi:DNA primase